jgi:hypothetical protein
MPKVSRDSATGGGEFGPVTDHSDQFEGYTVNFTSSLRTLTRRR